MDGGRAKLYVGAACEGTNALRSHCERDDDDRRSLRRRIEMFAAAASGPDRARIFQRKGKGRWSIQSLFFSCRRIHSVCICEGRKTIFFLMSTLSSWAMDFTKEKRRH